MNKHDKDVITEYLSEKRDQVVAEEHASAIRKDFYKACARNSIRPDKKQNRIVDLSSTMFDKKVCVREAFTKREWKYNHAILNAELRLQKAKTKFEAIHKPIKEGKRIWSVEIY